MPKRLFTYTGICIGLWMSLVIKLAAFPAASVIQDSVYTVSELQQIIRDSSAKKLMGKEFSVEGIANMATGLLHERYMQIFIQDDSSGISLFKFEVNEPVARGDSVVARGQLQNYFGLVEINVTSYRVFHRSKELEPKALPLQEIIDRPRHYEGILIHSMGVIKEKGTKFNGKYLKIAPFDTSSKSIMVYVTNFHALYQEFNFGHLSWETR